MRSLSTLLCVLLSAAAAVPASASSTIPEPGTRIRVTANVPASKRWIGPLLSVTRDTVKMRDDAMNDTVVAVPTLSITRFEISRGKSGNGLRGAAWGIGAGALFGAVVGYGNYSSTSDYFASSAGEAAAENALVFGVLGAGVGSLIGILNHSEHWHALPLEDLRGTGAALMARVLTAAGSRASSAAAPGVCCVASRAPQ